MLIGPLTFQIPERVIRRLIVRDRWQQREFRLTVIGVIIGTAATWFLAFASRWASGYDLVAISMTALLFSVITGPYIYARKLAKKLPGVITPQTWTFSDMGIVVENTDGTKINSPWSVVSRLSISDGYMNLHAKTGACSPIPLSLVGQEGVEAIRAILKH